jgi:hypothetical protein
MAENRCGHLFTTKEVNNMCINNYANVYAHSLGILAKLYIANWTVGPDNKGGDK